MKKFIAFIISVATIFGIVVGLPIMSFFILKHFFGTYVSLGLLIAAVIFIMVQVIIATTIIAYVNTRVASNSSNSSGEILTEDSVDTFTIVERDLTLQEYLNRIVFFHNDDTAEGIRSLEKYITSRIVDGNINLIDSPLPLVLKLLSSVDTKIPQSTLGILYGASGTSNNDDDGEEFSNLDLGETFKN